MKKSILNLAIIISIIIFPSIAFSKYKVCSITINSSNEIAQFKKSLPHNDFEFIELTSLNQILNPSDTRWLDRSCAQKTSCDILLISGHFGGEFFSDTSPIKLPLITMEQKSCDKKCEGIFHYPLEVFLLGCNTLSNKTPDHRTPEEYYEILRRDNFTPSQAQAVVESRYGSLGESYESRMQRIFPNAQHIYGFNSTSPKGSDLAPRLSAYFKAKGNYKNYIDKLHVKRMSGMLEGINQELKKSMKISSLTECPGSSLINNGDDNGLICKLISKETSSSEKNKILATMLSSENYLKFIPLIVEANEKKLISLEQLSLGLKDDLDLKKRVEKLTNTMSETPLFINYLSFSQSMGWINSNEFKKRAKNNIQKELAPPFTIEKTDRLCSMPENIKKLITIDDLSPYKERLSTLQGTRQFQCLQVKINQDYHKEVSKVLRDSVDSEHIRHLLWSIQPLAEENMFNRNETLKMSKIFIDENSRISNQKIMEMINKNKQNASTIYSFQPGQNLNNEEKNFLKTYISKGPDYFTGWEYAWLIRVAARSNYKDALISDAISKYNFHPRAQAAISDYLAATK